MKSFIYNLEINEKTRKSYVLKIKNKTDELIFKNN